MAQHGHSAACCSIPPVVHSGYEAKGKYETIGGVKTYVTGPSTASKALFFVPDIFGYYSQTVQGADILATSDENNQYLVFIPDFFDGKPADIAWYPPDNKEKEGLLGEFFTTTGEPGKASTRIPELVKAYEAQYTSIKTWAVLGFCWGGKVVSLTTSGKSSPFVAAAELHPAFVDPSEAEKIKIPLVMLASGDEPAEEVKKFEANLTAAKHVEIFADQIHGWMGARGNLADERVKSEYERGYKVVLDFFGKHVVA